MLFGYPIEATEDNWLHDCLTQIIQVIHLNVANGETSTDWLTVISEPYKSRLTKILRVSTKSNPKKLSLGDKLKNYQIKLASLSTPEQDKLLQAFNNQNKIPQLLCGELTCNAINDFPESIQETVKFVFEAAFKLLTNLEIRDKHYKEIYDACEYHICPFCGCEYFDAPGAPREALDHYIPEHKYPFAAANLRNLVPMGNKCNSRYKHTDDVLRKADGTPRKSFDPYNHRMVSISLENSQPFKGLKGDLGEPFPRWVIEFDSNSEEIDTWNEVFDIRERYKRDILNESFKSYLREFGNYCKSWNFEPDSHEALVEAIDRYVFFQDGNGFKDKAFIKAAVFRMLRLHCQNGNQRLVQLILDNVNGVQI
ncbi:MAG: hypothetical protein AAF327_07370 [Cyanobacteria bacterium P01_A01_bin.37]